MDGGRWQGGSSAVLGSAGGRVRSAEALTHSFYGFTCSTGASMGDNLFFGSLCCL